MAPRFFPLVSQIRLHMDGADMSLGFVFQIFPLPRLSIAFRVRWQGIQPIVTRRVQDGEWKPFTYRSLQNPVFLDIRLNPNLQPPIRRLFQAAVLQHLKYESRLGTGDAAVTALLCGAQAAALSATIASLPKTRNCTASVQALPSFSRTGWSLSARCIVRIPLGNLLVILARFLYDTIKKAVIEKWTSIRSKPSCEPPWKTSGT